MLKNICIIISLLIGNMLNQANATKAPQTFILRLSNQCIDKYESTKHCWFTPSPIVADGKIFVSDFINFVSAISQIDSHFIWREYFPAYSTIQLTDNNLLLVHSNRRYLDAIDSISHKIVWSKRLNYYESFPVTPVPVGEQSFLALRSKVISLNHVQGTTLWETDLEYDVFLHALAIDDEENVYVSGLRYSDGGQLYSLGKNTGQIQWIFSLPKDVKYPGDSEAFYATPCVSHRTVFALSSKKTLYAVDSKDGHQKWKHEMKSHDLRISDSTPYCGKDDVYVGFHSSLIEEYNAAIYNFDPVTGTTKWIYRTKGHSIGDIASHNNMLFVGGEDDKNKNYLFSINKDKGTLKWKIITEGMPSRPVINSGIVYFFTSAGMLYAVHEDTGKV